MDIDQYVDVLVDACKSSIEQMTNKKVNSTDKWQVQVLKDEKSILPFAHVITYKDYKEKFDGEFILGFENVNDALMLASSVAERLGLESFDKIDEDSTDLLKEFLNVVVGRTVSEWENIGFKVTFDRPVFKKNYVSKDSKHLKGYIIAMEIDPDTVNLEKENPVEPLRFRVNFIEKVENKLKNKKILIAEDSRVMRSIIGKILQEQGAKTKEAVDGEDAVKQHRIFKPDLTLMDINMPKISGLDAIVQIKEFHPDAKFIILSSSSQKDEILSAQTLEVSGYLVKPLEPEILIKRVQEVL